MKVRLHPECLPYRAAGIQTQQNLAQPDFNLLTDATQTVVHQLSLLPNIPIMNMQNQLDQVMGMLRGIDQHLHRIDARMDQLDARMDRLDARMDQLNTRMDEVDARMNLMAANVLATNRNSIARSINSTINRDNVALVPLVNQRNEEIHGFPRNLAALNRLTGRQLDILLREFDIPNVGDIEERRNQLRQICGVPPRF
ncbi:Gon7 (KEOPS protein complex) domain-containing protein [Histoplasma capsulatum]|uniref:Gon7 (KEOPS protein complex) domain-containing protein n=1 Tax=Ajellomyces capsulatus TaxID=5037 RepID=A0A8A1M557_AJECA|nr:Gon7 (KEOPS protein complex) domain-containing protein [Histoplasma capsulatum]